jgi:subtilisin family serine protease
LFRLVPTLGLVLALAALAVPAALSSPPADAPETVVVTYDSKAALNDALRRYPERIVRRLADVNAVEVAPADPEEYAEDVAALPGIANAGAPVRRYATAEPALAAMYSAGVPYEWQYAAARVGSVPDAVLRAAASVTIAVIDTGGDITAPDLAAKQPSVHNVLNGRADVRDDYGHGTFVASIAAGSVTNEEGLAGFGGDAKLLVIKAGRPDGSFLDVDTAEAIVYAVNHGAKVINLSIGGTHPSPVERNALRFAAESGVLVVAAAGNEFEYGNPIEYPAAALQPPRSNGRGGWGLSVAATTRAGKRASFSNTGSWISLAAPGEDVFGALSSVSDETDWPRYNLPGSLAGLYGFSSGTSFAAPQVAGAAALVWAANPSLSRAQVAWILKRTASGNGRWSSTVGYGILDVGHAVATASAGGEIVPPRRADAALSLAGPRRRVATRASIVIRGRLRSSLPAISSAGRSVALQVWRHGAWRRVARTRTKSAGSLAFRVRLYRGRYLMRIRFVGTPDLGSATSPKFALQVPRNVLRLR